MTTPLYVFGDTSYAQLIASFAAQCEQFAVMGFTVDKAFMSVRAVDGLPVVAFEALREAAPPGSAVFLACGYRDMRMREQLFERVATAGFVMPNIVAPGAHVAPGAQLGSNNVVMSGAVVEHNVSLGDNNTLWSNVTVCHDATFGSHNFLAANATIGGHVRAGSRNFLGFSSTVEQFRRLGDENLLGAMSYLHNDIEDHQRWLGIPARLVGNHAQAGLQVVDPDPAASLTRTQG